MNATYDPWLVLLSIIVSITASYVALDLASRVAAPHRSPAGKHRWLAAGAISMGGGIWSMHFIGMLGWRLPIPVSFDIPSTLLSLAIAVGVSWVALHTAGRNALNTPRLLSGGLLLGAGIAAMHYTGMSAMEMQPPLRYEPALFILSIVIAIAASMWALQSAFTLRVDTILSAFRKKAGSAIVMGSAIYGMHYTGMSAAIVAADSICTVNQQNINITSLAGSLGGFSLLFLMATLLISAFDAYLADFSAKYADSLRKLNLDLERQSTELSDANAGLKQEAQVRMRAEQALQQAHDALEERVAERTAQLVRSIQAMLAQIAERKRAEELLRESEAKLRDVIEDRERLARDLHDNIVQAIYAIGMRLEECQRLVRDSPDEVTAQLAQVIDGLNSVIREVRRYIAGSQRQFPRERQLRAHLDQLVAAIQSAEAPRFQLDVDNNAIEHLSRDDAEQVLSIARETLSNCLQHSHARHGTVALRLAGGGVRLEISDDGVGFEPQQPAQAGGGLRNMRNRARQIGAEFEVLSSPGQGTRIIVQIPKRRKVDDLE